MNITKEKMSLSIFEAKERMMELKVDMMMDQIEITEDSLSLETKVENFRRITNLYIDEIEKVIKILENIEKEYK